MSSKMRVSKLDNGKWVVEFYSRHDDSWGSFDDQTQHDTRRAAEDEMRHWQMQSARDDAADRNYQSQIAYACGERD